MNFRIFWEILDSNFLQTMSVVVVGYFAYRISKLQYQTMDTVELHAYLALEKIDDNNLKPYIRVQNIGTKIIYLDYYIFNGRNYLLNKQVLPSVYSQATASFYWIELPTNGESHVSVTVVFYDLNMKHYQSEIIAEKQGEYWQVSTFPKKLL